MAAGAEFLGGGGDFQNIAGGETVFDLLQVGTSDTLLSLVSQDIAQSFFGAANLPGGQP